MTDESVCLDAPDVENADQPQVRILPCSEVERQRWTYEEKTKHILHIASRLCLDLPTKENSETLSLRKCDTSSKGQLWVFDNENWFSIK